LIFFVGSYLNLGGDTIDILVDGY